MIILVDNLKMSVS